MIRGDARRIPLADRSVHCCVTSPPFYGLRDYGDDGQIGLESTPSDYVARMVEVFREVRRVMRDDATLWLNLGDSYAGGGIRPAENNLHNAKAIADRKRIDTPVPPGLKPKDLIGIPWRVAFALQADGWYLRSDIIWSKPNPMPESVTDRPTRAHEYIFLLAKGERYHYDAGAMREDASSSYGKGATGRGRNAYAIASGFSGNPHQDHSGWMGGDGVTRNRRSVWTVATRPYAGAHFATFPDKLIEPCILAGCPEKACPECGAPWDRVTERRGGHPSTREARGLIRSEGATCPNGKGSRTNITGTWEGPAEVVTLGFEPTCSHGREPVPGVCFDPFGGAGTTVQVALALGRRGVLTELAAPYLRLARRRIARPHAPTERTAREEHLPLFGEPT